MVSIGDVLYKFLDLHYQGSPNNASRKKLPIMYTYAKNIRASLIKEKLDKSITLSDDLVSTIKVELEPIVFGEGNQRAYKSKTKIPAFISECHVGTTDGSVYYTEVGKTAALFQSSGRYSKNRKAFFIEDDYLYILDSSFKSCVQVRGILEDPLDLASECDQYVELDFYVDENTVDTITNIYIQKYFQLGRQIQSDKTDDNVSNNE